MQKTIKQYYAIKFCEKLGKSGTESLDMHQQAYGDDCQSKGQVFRWVKIFKEGWDSVKNKDHSRHPSTSKTDENFDRVHVLLNTNRRMSVRMIADALGLDKMTVHNIITKELSMRKICTKMVQKILSDIQKQACVDACQTISRALKLIRNHNVITGDETWMNFKRKLQ
ncbi:protein GVQW3-like [Schistocerca cancellata]|uniref:protein GVQW3-like n=1 Tax=Schistocerca cancellata TaxID=274614 RepID=UPI002118AD41|nr:protein GVQW3-like [Schistocerca cancellata]